MKHGGKGDTPGSNRCNVKIPIRSLRKAAVTIQLGLRRGLGHRAPSLMPHNSRLVWCLTRTSPGLASPATPVPAARSVTPATRAAGRRCLVSDGRALHPDVREMRNDMPGSVPPHRESCVTPGNQPTRRGAHMLCISCSAAVTRRPFVASRGGVGVGLRPTTQEWCES